MAVRGSDEKRGARGAEPDEDSKQNPAGEAPPERQAGSTAAPPAGTEVAPASPDEEGPETVVLDSMDDLAFAAEGDTGLDHRHDRTVSQNLEDLVAPSEAGAKACFIVMRGAQVGRLYDLSDGEAILGRSDDVTIPIADNAVSRRHAAVHSSPLGFVITDLDSTNGLFVNGKRLARHVLRDADRIQFGTSTVLKFSYQDELEESLQKGLYESATRDTLVGIHNRQYFLDSLEAAFASAARKRQPLSLLMLDVDHFKNVNDSYGHLAGDHVLKEIAALVREAIRTEDVFARFGGEEFVLLFADSARGPASLVAERICRLIEARIFEYEDRQIRLTTSIGVTTYVDGNYATPESLIAGADAALYEAKRSGRNRIVWREQAVPPGKAAEEA